MMGWKKGRPPNGLQFELSNCSKNLAGLRGSRVYYSALDEVFPHKLSLNSVSEKSKKAYKQLSNHFSDCGGICVVDMVLICTYKCQK